jgi:hypothetical protein
MIKATSLLRLAAVVVTATVGCIGATRRGSISPVDSESPRQVAGPATFDSNKVESTINSTMGIFILDVFRSASAAATNELGGPRSQPTSPGASRVNPPVDLSFTAYRQWLSVVSARLLSDSPTGVIDPSAQANAELRPFFKPNYSCPPGPPPGCTKDLERVAAENEDVDLDVIGRRLLSLFHDQPQSVRARAATYLVTNYSLPTPNN